jgi:hypothetical protein
MATRGITAFCSHVWNAGAPRVYSCGANILDEMTVDQEVVELA